MGGICTTQTTQSTTAPSDQVLANLQNSFNTASNVAGTPFKPYSGELTAPLNQGQQTAIGQLQGAATIAQPFMQQGATYLGEADQGLGNVQNYLQAGSGAYAQAGGFANQSSQALGGVKQYQDLANKYYGQAATLATPIQFSQDAIRQYESPYTQDVIDATQAQFANANAQQSNQLIGNAIGSGAYGSDRSGLAQAALAGQQATAQGATIAGLYNQNYAQALGQFNQTNATRQAGAGLLNQTAAGETGLGQLQGQVAQQYGTLANTANQTGAGYQGLGALQGQTAAQYGTLAGQAGQLGQTAENTYVQGASAALQGATLQQQTQQAADAAKYGQFTRKLQYPFQTSQFLTGAATGTAAGMGSTTSTDGSLLSQLAGAGTAGLGILGGTGAFGSTGYLTNMFKAEGGGVVAPRDTFAKGGGIVSLASLPHMSKFRPTAGLVRGIKGLRPHFDDGGVVDLGNTDALTGGANDNSLGVSLAMPTGRSGAGGAGGAGGANRAPQPQQPQQGLGVVSGAPISGSSAGLGSAPTNADAIKADPFGAANQNLWMGVASAGLGMMSGTSMSPLANIGAGGLQGLQTYERLQQQDRTNALSQAEAQNRALQLQESIRHNQADERYQQGVLTNAETQTALRQSTAASENAARDQATQIGRYQRTFVPGVGYMVTDLTNPTAPPVIQKIAPDATPDAPQAGAPGVGGAPAASPVAGGVVPASPSSAPAGVSGAPAPAPASGGLVPPAPAMTASPGTSRTANVPASSGTGQAPAPSAPVPAVHADIDYGYNPESGTPITLSAPTASASPTPARRVAAPQGAPAAAPAGGKPLVPAQAWAGMQADPNSPYAGSTVVPAQIPADFNRVDPKYNEQVLSRGSEVLKGAETAAQAAASQKLSLAEMQNDLAAIPSTGFLAAGPGQQARAAIASKANAVMSSLGISKDNQIDPNAIGASEEIKKLSTKMGFDLARSLGGREPGMVVNMATQSVPTSENSPIGAQRLMAGLSATAQRQIDYNEFAQKWAAKTAGNTDGMDQAFNKANPPQAYADKAITSTIPPAYVQRMVETAKTNPASVPLFEQKFGPGTAAAVFRALNIRVVQ